jgi:hypothetical protein
MLSARMDNLLLLSQEHRFLPVQEFFWVLDGQNPKRSVKMQMG